MNTTAITITSTAFNYYHRYDYFTTKCTDVVKIDCQVVKFKIKAFKLNHNPEKANRHPF